MQKSFSESDLKVVLFLPHYGYCSHRFWVENLLNAENSKGRKRKLTSNMRSLSPVFTTTSFLPFAIIKGICMLSTYINVRFNTLVLYHQLYKQLQLGCCIKSEFIISETVRHNNLKTEAIRIPTTLTWNKGDRFMFISSSLLRSTTLSFNNFRLGFLHNHKLTYNLMMELAFRKIATKF